MKPLLTNAATLLLSLLSYPAISQDREVQKIIRQKDSLFWIAYNSCDADGMNQYVTDDLEFYHDKGGITLGKEDFSNITKKNLCGNKDFRLRREEVAGSTSIFPMAKDGVAYGGVISGQHHFYINQTGKKEYLDGLARFTHLWLLKDGNWKMARILSYDHGPAPYVNKKTAIEISRTALKHFAGNYKSENGIIDISVDDKHLLLSTNTQQFPIFPEQHATFFSKERDLTFEFVSNKAGKVVKMVVREHGEIVQENALAN